MENDVIVFLINGGIIGWLIVTVLMALAKGLPLAGETVDEVKQLVLKIAPILRRLFDPNTALANALKAKGVDPAIADSAAELTADVLEALVGGTVREVQPKAE